MSKAAESSEFVEASSTSVDRRDGVRVAIEAEVEMTSFAKFLGRAGDLSVGGIYVETHEDLDIDSEVTLEMWVPEAEEYLALHGEVRWLDTDDADDGMTGYGIEFVDMTSQARDRLEQIVGDCGE